ncbi:MAG: lytic transglycosylase domain-containing protein [Nocardioidaceae bacterium]
MASHHKAAKGAPRWQQALGVVPLALLAAAWTVSLGSHDLAFAVSHQRSGIPTVPTTPFSQRASLTVPPKLTAQRLVASPGTFRQRPGAAAATESANGIPTAALAAYQRAALVLSEADPSCHLSWALIAAIGRVESDHGRSEGNVLNATGIATPGIYGPELNGRDGRALVRDTDNGTMDHDPRYDRAVGPMQFLPGTWQIVGVDGDGDGIRNPQDINDAALAAGVYLCAGQRNLATTSGQQAAVLAYNHSPAYMHLVLAIMRAYQHGEFTTVPDGLPVASVGEAPATRRAHTHHDARGPHRGGQPTTSGSTTSGPSRSRPSATSPTTRDNPTGSPTTFAPTTSSTPPLDPVTSPVHKAVLTLEQAGAMCASSLADQLQSLLVGATGIQTAVSTCAHHLVGLTRAQATNFLGQGLLSILDALGLSLTDLLGPVL